jgi:iron(II)-dependent oxidoreductase
LTQARLLLEQARDAVKAIVLDAPEEAWASKHVQEFSPLLWHLGHTAFIEAQWVAERLAGDDGLTRDLHGAFNALQVEKSQRPTAIRDLAWTLDYRTRVFQVVDALLENPPAPTDAVAERLLSGSTLVDFLAQHHFQHAETMRASLRLYYFTEAKARWNEVDAAAQAGGLQPDSNLPPFVSLDPLMVEIGATSLFAYDNEMPAHRRQVDAFELGQTPITNAQWLFHMGKSQGALPPPLGWIKVGKTWVEATTRGYRPLLPDAPVLGVSHAMAHQFAETQKARLPTEFEWERAARGALGRRFAWGDEEPDISRASFAGRQAAPLGVKAHPAGKTPEGIWGMCGQAWEWTASLFAPYDGFSFFPYRGYSETSFDGKHRVLRGGSFATHGPLLRTTFRNFYGEDIPEILATLRLCRDGG